MLVISVARSTAICRPNNLGSSLRHIGALTLGGTHESVMLNKFDIRRSAGCNSVIQGCTCVLPDDPE